MMKLLTSAREASITESSSENAAFLKLALTVITTASVTRHVAQPSARSMLPGPWSV